MEYGTIIAGCRRSKHGKNVSGIPTQVRSKVKSMSGKSSKNCQLESNSAYGRRICKVRGAVGRCVRTK